MATLLKVMKTGDKVVCIAHNWNENDICEALKTFIVPKGFPVHQKVYVINNEFLCEDGRIGLSFVGGLTAFQKEDKDEVGFCSTGFKLLEEVQKENSRLKEFGPDFS